MAEGSRHTTGQTGEFLVAAELARRGLSVALFTGNAVDVDMLAYRANQKFAIQVKSTAHLNHQFDLRRFVEVGYTADGKQIIGGPLRGLDLDIIVALVQIGQTHAEDSILWTRLDSFANCLAAFQRWFVESRENKRPGSSPPSTRMALAHPDLKEQLHEMGGLLTLDAVLSPQVDAPPAATGQALADRPV